MSLGGSNPDQSVIVFILPMIILASVPKGAQKIIGQARGGT